MITRKFSKRFQKWSYELDIRVKGGKRMRHTFEKKSEAEAIEALYKRNDFIAKYDLPIGTGECPTLVELIEKRRIALAQNPKEWSRSKGIFAQLVEVLPKGILVNEVTRALLAKYVEKRFADKISAESISRELNSVNAMLRSAARLFEDDHGTSPLASWRPPEMPRPKCRKGRRERVWNEREIAALLDQLERPRQPDEVGRASKVVKSRQRAALVVRFCLLTGLRPGEVARMRFYDIDWSNRKIRVADGKNDGRIKMIGPLGDAGMAILESFARVKSGDAPVFFRGPRVPGKFYDRLREACERAGIRYGRSTPGGVALYDTRHTATTAMLEAGVSPPAVQAWMGWSNAAFVQYYGHATDRSREQAGQALEGLAPRRKLRIAS